MRVTSWCVLAGWLAQVAPAEALDLVRRHLHRRVTPESLLSWAPDERSRLLAKWENRIAVGSPADEAVPVSPAPIAQRDQLDERDDGGTALDRKRGALGDRLGEGDDGGTTLDRRRGDLEARQAISATSSFSLRPSSSRSLTTPSATGSGQVALTNYQSDLRVLAAVSVTDSRSEYYVCRSCSWAI